MGNSDRKYRFYIWDYIWWLGETFNEVARPKMNPIDGGLLLSLYLLDAVTPLMMLPALFVRNNPEWMPLFIIAWIAIFFGAMSLINRHYKSRRGIAVKRHYSWHYFSQLRTVLTFILAIAILILEMFLANKFLF